MIIAVENNPSDYSEYQNPPCMVQLDPVGQQIRLLAKRCGPFIFHLEEKLFRKYRNSIKINSF